MQMAGLKKRVVSCPIIEKIEHGVVSLIAGWRGCTVQAAANRTFACTIARTWNPFRLNMTNSSSPTPLVFFRVLANQARSPAGLLMELGPGAAADVLPVFAGETFRALATEIPCYFRPALAAPLAEALAEAGWKPLVLGTVLRADKNVPQETVPAGTLLIEGDWYMQAPPKATGAQAASQALALQLAQLIAADAHTHEIEALLRKDPTLSYHLLRLVNSLGMGVGRRITSFTQAILILGRQQLRRWVNLMLFAARQGDVRSGMLLARVAVRGRLLEQLTRMGGGDKHAQDQAFITGMFSLLGVLFGMELTELLAPLSISDTVQDALLGYSGELGQMLRLCEAFEDGDFAGVGAALGTLEIGVAAFNDAVVEANRWMLGAIDGATSASA
jgi:EAL and modified HD-GYP domain-containing signal transduction protein